VESIASAAHLIFQANIFQGYHRTGSDTKAVGSEAGRIPDAGFESDPVSPPTLH